MKNPHPLGAAPIEPEYIDQMKAVAQGLDEIFNGETKGPPRKLGFVLMVFPFGAEDGRCNTPARGAFLIEGLPRQGPAGGVLVIKTTPAATARP
jgi:hypothetical protein